MSVQVENLEKNMAKLTIEVAAEKVEDAIQAAYMKEKGKISVPGFRKGKVPRKMIEKMYGAVVFYEDAANTLIQENYAQAVEESGVDVVSRPTIEVVQIEAGKPFIFTAEVAVRPEVKLGKYKGVQVTKIDTTVSDEEVAAELEKERQKNSRTVTVTDRPIAEGDTAVIDFEGFVDGVAFEGGKGENHPLEIGSHSFIDTFEDQLVGKNAGDEVDVNVTFPEKYQAADLAGKPALFKVKIHEVKAKELPELNDEFAQDVSEFNTLEEYKEDLKKHLEVQKEDEAKRTKEDEAIQKIIDKYKGVQVTKIDTTVSDEEVAAELEKERQKNSRTVTVTDRPIAEGDTAVIDFEGFVDGVAFEGGKGENHPLEIGSHSFIDTFEDQLVGKNAGDEVDVNVTFPEKYQAADLAGKPALFKVKIHEVKAKELPELNDEFAQDVSEFNTLEEYKEDLKKHLEVQKEDEAKRTKEDEAIQKIIDKSTMEIPEAMIKTQCENMVNEFAQRLAQSGLSMEQYMQFSGLTLDKLEEQVRPEAETRIKSSLVLEQIAKDENIEVSEEEIDAEIEKMAKAYGMEADKLKEYMGDAEKESMKRDISVTKAVDLVMENVKERAKAKTKKEKEAEAEENAEENAEE